MTLLTGIAFEGVRSFQFENADLLARWRMRGVRPCDDQPIERRDHPGRGAVALDRGITGVVGLSAGFFLVGCCDHGFRAVAPLQTLGVVRGEWDQAGFLGVELKRTLELAQAQDDRCIAGADPVSAGFQSVGARSVVRIAGHQHDALRDAHERRVVRRRENVA